MANRWRLPGVKARYRPSRSPARPVRRSRRIKEGKDRLLDRVQQPLAIVVAFFGLITTGFGVASATSRSIAEQAREEVEFYAGAADRVVRVSPRQPYDSAERFIEESFTDTLLRTSRIEVPWGLHVLYGRAIRDARGRVCTARRYAIATHFASADKLERLYPQLRRRLISVVDEPSGDELLGAARQFHQACQSAIVLQAEANTTETNSGRTQTISAPRPALGNLASPPNPSSLSLGVAASADQVLAPALASAGRASAPSWVMNRSAVDPAGWDIDVFACESGGEASLALATKAAAELASAADERSRLAGEKLGRIRLRMLSSSAGEGRDLPRNVNAVVADGTGSAAPATEEPLALAIADRLRSSADFEVRANTGSGSAWYLALTACAPSEVQASGRTG